MDRQNYLVIPFLVWAAIRFGPRGTSTAAVIFTLTATWGTLYHLEGFAITDAQLTQICRGGVLPDYLT